MTDVNILWIALILYMLGMAYSYMFDKRLMMLVAVLWFVPVFVVDNTLIIVFCCIMFIAQITIPLMNKEEDF
jgi:hypothetical protein